MHTLNAASLAKMSELAVSRAHPKVIAHLAGVLTGDAPLAAYKMNAFCLADEVGVTKVEAVRSLLIATRLGLLDLNWDLFCPSCIGIPEYFKHLIDLAPRAHCDLCNIDWNVDIEDQTEVTFTANPDVRRIDYADFGDRKWPDQIGWWMDAVKRDKRMLPLADVLGAGEKKQYEKDLPADDYSFHVMGHVDKAVQIRVAGERAAAPQRVSFVVEKDGRVEPRQVTLAPGPVHIDVDFRFERLWGIAMVAKTRHASFVSASYVFAQQDFRDLFSGEFLAPGVSFGIRSVTLMFTDIKGSTEMYEAMGDAPAYGLVQQHFRIMTEAIAAHEGGIVKTIGDAVMAAFPVNAQAVAAALHIQQEISRLSTELGGIEVKMGLHRGPAIAVTTNRSLDYFGSTVNIAARVQGRSEPREVLVSEDVFRDPAVKELLSGRIGGRGTFDAQLKGIERPIKVLSVV